MEKTKETPLMQQYNRFKAQHPDAILLFRVGDFYETYGEDAVQSSKILGITLTKHGKGVTQTQLAGFPYHALDVYLPKLVRAGKRVAICEQLEDPKFAKKLVKRGITEMVTPGVSINDKVLEQKENNFLAALQFTEKTCGIAFVDISTGEFYVAEGDYDYIDKLFQNFKHYLYETQNHKIQHINKINRIEEEHYVWLDRFTIRNLELVGSANENAVTLLQVLDQTQTPMGSRMLRKWMLMPLKEKVWIDERLSMVEFFMQHEELACDLGSALKRVGDLERMVSKIATGKINPREVLQLARALRAVEQMKTLCEKADHPALAKIAEQLNPCLTICTRIEKEINEDSPVVVSKGGVFNRGVDAELDELFALATNSREVLGEIQRRESERTGIPSLKIGFNNVFGYYIEVTNTHKDKVPIEWTRKQTLTNGERYITEELKDLESKILGAQDKMLEIESRLYNELLVSLLDYIAMIQLNARLTARIDVLLCFATVSEENGYVKPIINEGTALDIKGGRHPVIERQLPPGEPYIANDVYLDNKKQQIIIITGPNMSGKSALLRQTALIVLMAQMGCFVPARKADIGIVDKIFTRVGASDNISTGESTFMVEMNETASILNNISDRSLILLDEIGRGTSTYDGVSIAWSIAEFLHENVRHRAKVLFATHYHELNDMADQFPRIQNYHVTVKEIDNKVFFLRKLEKGGSEHSFGIHVARMAGMPQQVLRRAEEILKQLEKSRSDAHGNKIAIEKSSPGYQLSFINLDDPLLLEVKDLIVGIDINSLTPVEALMKLNEIQQILTGKRS